jgi:catechol 2,3-dioxygenase-like lactoylglutathione lyase family enzyme
MSLADARVETRLPTQDLQRARRWYGEKLGLVPTEEREGGLRYQCAAGIFCLLVCLRGHLGWDIHADGFQR